jgi:hypothetical protein
MPTVRGQTGAGVLVLCLALAHAQAAPGGEAQARREFALGKAAFDARQYDLAVEHFQAGYDLSGTPLFLYNVGNAARRAGRWTVAKQAFLEYLRLSPRAVERRDIGLWMVEIEQHLAAEPPPAEPTPEPAPPPPPRRRPPAAVAATVVTPPPPPRRIGFGAPVALGVVTVAALGVGLGLYFGAGAQYDDLAAQGCGTSRNCDVSGGRSLEAGGIALLAIGGAAAVVDIALWGAWGTRRAR